MPTRDTDSPVRISRRTALGGMAGGAISVLLPAANIVSGQRTDEEVASSITLTPRPDETDVGGLVSLGGTWDFTLSPSETPPSGTGSTRTPDASSAGNDGTLLNDPSVLEDASEQALDLAGDAAVSVESASSLNFTATGFTVQAQVRYTGGDGVILDKGKSSGGTEQFGLGVYGGEPSFWIHDHAANWPTVTAGTLSEGEWHTVTAVVDDGENRLYVDGSQVGSVAHEVEGLVSSDAPFIVGGNGLDVDVKTTRAFDAALTEEQIRGGFASVPDNTVLWLQYDEIIDRAVEFRDEDVPGQWAYDGHFDPDDEELAWYHREGEYGWYRREFDVPAGFQDGRIKLRFGAVYSRAWVYLNGTQVTEHVGGYTPFEVDVTDEVDPSGTNTLAVRVSQRSPANDMDWQSVTGGIIRDVELIGVPRVYVADCYVTTGLEDDGSAIVAVETTVQNDGDQQLDSGGVTVTLIDSHGSTVDTVQTDLTSLSAGRSAVLSSELSVRDPTLWNPERPALYDVDVELSADDTTETVHKRVGIREVGIDGNDLLLNGESITLRGVNWEEIHLPEHGAAVPEEITREDAKLLKEANVNYVRTAHNPVSEAFLEACDELGIVVQEEAPVMFLGGFRLGDEGGPELSDPYSDLVYQQNLEMVKRDRSRTSVCIWSVANESAWFDVFEAIAQDLDAMDPTRPKVFNHDVYDAYDPWRDMYEIESHHYPALRTGSTISQTADLSDPITYDEYAHTYTYNDRELVTDPGLRDQWGIAMETIWERCRDADAVAGAALWAGGDHLEQWGDYFWGMLDRYRRPRPEYWHVKKTYAPVKLTDTEWSDDGNSVDVTVENRHEFVNLTERSATVESGDASQDVTMDVPPGESETITFPVEGPDLTLTVTHPDGFTVNEITLSADSTAVQRPDRGDDLTVTSTDGALEFGTDAPSVSVDTGTGEVEIQSPDGDPLVVGAPELAITPTQASTGREYASAIDHQLRGRTVTDVSTTDDEDGIAVSVEYDGAEGTFVLRPLTGAVEIEYDFTLTRYVSAREVGVAIPGDPSLRSLSWSRDGLWNAYPDDHVGRQTGTASAFPSGSRPANEGIQLQSGQPWKDDATIYGSNDFRGTKRNVYTVELSDGSDTWFRVLSDGTQHARAQVRSDSVALLVLEQSISGTSADWLDRYPLLEEDPNLAPGDTIEGSVTLQIAEDVTGDDGDGDHGVGSNQTTSPGQTGFGPMAGLAGLAGAAGLGRYLSREDDTAEDA